MVAVLENDVNKKIVCLFLSVVLLLSMLVIPSYAVENSGELISVDLEWTNMSFLFNEGTWDESKHTYNGRGWSAEGNGGEITVSNSGSVAVNASFEYAAGQGFEDISVQFLKENKAISAQNIETNESVTVSVHPMGEPSGLLEATRMGTIVVTITKIGEVNQ